MTEPSGLGRFGVTPRTPIRQHATDGDLRICAECGHPIGATQGPQRVAHPDLVDQQLANALGDQLIVFGWRCVNHQTPVVAPLVCDPNADSVTPPIDADSADRWTGVRLRFADQEVRRREVE